jgi:hypothetical protein
LNVEKRGQPVFGVSLNQADARPAGPRRLARMRPISQSMIHFGSVDASQGALGGSSTTCTYLVCGRLVDIVDHDDFEGLFLRRELETQRFNTKKKSRGLVIVITTLHRVAERPATRLNSRLACGHFSVWRKHVVSEAPESFIAV